MTGRISDEDLTEPEFSEGVKKDFEYSGKGVDVDICRICGRSTSDHSNPNTDYRGFHGTSPPTDHYFWGGDEGGSDDKLYFVDKKGKFIGYP